MYGKCRKKGHCIIHSYLEFCSTCQLDRLLHK